MTRKLRSLMVVCLMMIATAAMAMVQQEPSGGQPKRNDKQRPNMEQFAKMQAKHIAQKLALDDKTSQKFVETFCNCRKEMAATRGGHHHKKSEMTDAEADKVIKADFQQGRKLLSIREKYYKAYSKFLTPKQILRVYDMERQDMKRFAQRAPKKGDRFKPQKGKPGQPKAQN